jgi:hypothetical protein
MTYEYERKQGGLGALGWSEAFGGRQSCQVPGGAAGGSLICGLRSEEQFLTNQTCRPISWMGESQCQTVGGNPGTYWCCPPGRPGTGAAPVEQLPMSRLDIQSLQSYINRQEGCSAGTVDGKWGPNTQLGAECVAQRDGWASLTGRFPFLSTLMATPEGRIREPMVFDPGTGYAKPGDPGTTKTPAEAGIAQVATSLQAGQQAPAELLQQPSLLARIPWWGWLGIAGGFGLLVVLGMAIYQSGEEEALGLPSPGGAEEGGYWDWSDVRAGL